MEKHENGDSGNFWTKLIPKKGIFNVKSKFSLVFSLQKHMVSSMVLIIIHDSIIFDYTVVPPAPESTNPNYISQDSFDSTKMAHSLPC